MKVGKNNILLISVLIISMLLSSYGWSGIKKKQDGVSGKQEFHKSLLVSENKSDQQSNINSPSRGKAFLLSLLIPGWGEYYAGSPKMAKIFLGAEIALWTSYCCFRVYGNWRENDYKNFAIAHAHINPAGKDHDYFVNIEHYDDIQTYNQTKLQQRNLDALYPENREYSWKWDNKSNRLKYEKIRMSSDQAFSNSVLLLGIVVVNHIVSGIDAMRVAIKADKDTSSLKMGLSPVPGGGVQLWLVTKF